MKEPWATLAKHLPGLCVVGGSYGRWSASWSPNATNFIQVEANSESELLKKVSDEQSYQLSVALQGLKVVKLCTPQVIDALTRPPKEQVKPKTPVNPYKRKFG